MTARIFPCLDPDTNRYTPGLCSACESPRCWMGRKPARVRPLPVLHAGQKHCAHCSTPFTPLKRSRALYCSDTCRYEAMMGRRRRRSAERAHEFL